MNYMNELLAAIDAENNPLIEQLLGESTLADTRRDGEVSVLHKAVCGEDPAVVALLLDQGSMINAKNKKGNTPLHKASRRGSQAVVKQLLDRGATVNEINYYGDTPLHLAVARGDQALVALLLNRGALINACNNTGNTPLYNIATHHDENNCQAVTTLLLDRGAIVNLTNQYGDTPLHLAAYMGNRVVTKLLLAKHEAIVNIRNKTDNTPLHQAVGMNYDEISCYEVVKLLLDKGAIVNVNNKYRDTPLHLAARNNHAATQLLLDKGAMINVQNEEGTTPLEEALLEINIPVARLLLQQGAYSYFNNSKHDLLVNCWKDLNEYWQDPASDKQEVESFYAFLCLAGANIVDQELPNSLQPIKYAIEETIIKWLAPLQLPKAVTPSEAMQRSEQMYQEYIPSVLKALPRLLKWTDRIKEKEKKRARDKQNGYIETLEERILVSSVGDELLTKSMRKVKATILEQLNSGVLPEELLLLLRKHLIHKTLVDTLMRFYPMPLEVANYLVAEVTAAHEICASFHKRLFQHAWPDPCEAPMTPSMQRIIDSHTKSFHP